MPPTAVVKKPATRRSNTTTPKKATPAKIEWQYSSLEDDVDIVNILYYGEPGTAKTTNLAALTRLGPVVYVEAESGLKKTPLNNLGVPTDRGVLRVVRDTPDEDQITFRRLKALADRLRGELADNPGSIAGVVWDSITEIQKKLLRNTVRKQWEWAQSKGLNRDEHFIDRADYGTNTEEMRDLVRMYRDLPCHVGFSALEVRDEDDDGITTYRPNLTPKLATDVTGFVDVVCYTQDRIIGGKRFYLGTFKRGGKFQAKDRFGLLPEVLATPSYDRVIGYINGSLTEDDDEIQAEFKQAREASKRK